MSVFQFPKYIAQKFDSITTNFFWGFRGDKPAMHLSAYHNLCRPRNQGGLGLRSFHLTNRALLAKQFWNIYNNQGSVTSKWIIGKYFHGSLQNNAVVTTQPSRVWKSISVNKSLIQDYLRWNVGTGVDIHLGSKFWWNPLPSKPPEIQTVRDLRASPTGGWDRTKVHQCFDPLVADQILRTPLSFCNGKDKLYWSISPNGVYSVASGYSWLLSQQVALMSDRNSNFRWDVFWKVKVPYKLLVFAWRLYNNALPLIHTLRKHHFNAQGGCVFCDYDSEDSEHIFMHCSFTRAVWFGALPVALPSMAVSHNIQSWLHSFLLLSQSSVSGTSNWFGLALLTLHSIWITRNRCHFDGLKLDPLDLIQIIQAKWHMFADAAHNIPREQPRPRRSAMDNIRPISSIHEIMGPTILLLIHKWRRVVSLYSLVVLQGNIVFLESIQILLLWIVTFSSFLLLGTSCWCIKLIWLLELL